MKHIDVIIKELIDEKLLHIPEGNSSSTINKLTDPRTGIIYER
jgi:hypothetical protein